MFLKDIRFNLFALMVISVAQICLADLTLPVHDSLWSIYDDSIENGSSRNLKLTITNDSIEWLFKLRAGAPCPYTGLVVTLQQPFMTNLAWQVFNERDCLVIELSSNREGPLLIQLNCVDPNVTKKDDPVSFRTLETTITVTKKNRRVLLPLHQFRIANWWKSRYSISPEDNNLYLNSICSVDFVFIDSSRYNRNDTLRIYSLQLKHHNQDALVGLIVTFVVLVILIILKVLKKKKSSEIVVTSGSDMLQPAPVVVASSEWERVKLYFEHNYLDPGLNLQKSSDALCLSVVKLSKVIRENHKQGFRSLIHELRTKEAKRLLRETDLNVAEIAFKLGYTTPSHFNREFKSREGMTPTAFRRT